MKVRQLTQVYGKTLKRSLFSSSGKHWTVKKIRQCYTHKPMVLYMVHTLPQRAAIYMNYVCTYAPQQHSQRHPTHVQWADCILVQFSLLCVSCGQRKCNCKTTNVQIYMCTYYAYVNHGKMQIYDPTQRSEEVYGQYQYMQQMYIIVHVQIKGAKSKLASWLCSLCMQSGFPCTPSTRNMSVVS